MIGKNTKLYQDKSTGALVFEPDLNITHIYIPVHQLPNIQRPLICGCRVLPHNDWNVELCSKATHIGDYTIKGPGGRSITYHVTYVSPTRVIISE